MKAPAWLGRAALAGVAAALGELPRNSHLWTYVICGFGGDPYITRTLLPRLPLVDYRLMLHRIHREDIDPHMHNHPWRDARFLVLSGGYVEERLVDGEAVRFDRRTGDVNELGAGTFHRIVDLRPDTWTIGLIGPRVQDWGFLVDGALVPWREYFARNNHEAEGGG